MQSVVLCRDAKGREAVKFVTPSGVTAWIATDISDRGLARFARSLQRKLRARELRDARRALRATSSPQG